MTLDFRCLIFEDKLFLLPDYRKQKFLSVTNINHGDGSQVFVKVIYYTCLISTNVGKWSKVLLTIPNTMKIHNIFFVGTGTHSKRKDRRADMIMSTVSYGSCFMDMSKRTCPVSKGIYSYEY